MRLPQNKTKSYQTISKACISVYCFTVRDS